MKKLTFLLMICSFFAATSVFGQWNGSSNANGNIDRNGNVGIGISSPTSQLHIKANPTSYPAAFTLENSLGKYTVSSNFGGYFDIDYKIPFQGSSISGKALRIGRFGTDYHATVDFQAQTEFNNVSTFNSNVIINNSRLLLSDGDNQIELTSDGLVHAREIEVDLVAIPDYVFEDDYNLMPLTELQKFIDLNHHLPNIKSAAEYEERGSIALKELNIKLLEKVEELTLYTLEQEQEIETLKKQMAEMQKMLEQLSANSKN